MTYAPEHTFVDVAYRQQQLRHEADAYRRARGYRVVPRRRTRGAVGKAAVAVVARIRRSVDSLTEWPHPV